MRVAAFRANVTAQQLVVCVCVCTERNASCEKKEMNQKKKKYGSGNKAQYDKINLLEFKLYQAGANDSHDTAASYSQGRDYRYL